jgi:DNA-binding transcriptional ArsR family regulator
MTRQEILFKALGHEKRLKILKWLKNPLAYFPPQKDGDLEKDGVCVLLIAEKLKVSQPTATQHLKILQDAKLVLPNRIGKWTFIRRNEEKLSELKEIVGAL